jgi:hypothetical protein
MIPAKVQDPVALARLAALLAPALRDLDSGPRAACVDENGTPTPRNGMGALEEHGAAITAAPIDPS